MGDENQEARLAVAVNDIEWIKESQRSTNKGIEQLQTTLSQHMKEQNERAGKYATKEDVNAIQADVDKLKAKVYIFSGIMIVVGVLFKYAPAWLTRGGAH